MHLLISARSVRLVRTVVAGRLRALLVASVTLVFAGLLAPDADAAGAKGDLVVLPVEVPAKGAKKTYRMGWSVDDATYLRSIPRAARTIRLFPALLGDDRRFAMPFGPVDVRMTAHKPDAVRFRSYEAMPGKTRWVPRKVWVDAVGNYEQWWLQDAKGFLAVISIDRASGRTYFFGVRGTAANPRKNARYVDGDQKGLVATGNDHCYGCHPSGLRKIMARKGDPEVNWARLKQLNRQILAHRATKWGPEVKPSHYGKSIPQCRKCHNNSKRGALYPIHAAPVHYKVMELHSMPPREPLQGKDAQKLMHWLGKRAYTWYRRQCKRGDIASCKLLGVMLVDGNGGMGVDLSEALKLFQFACGKRDGVACVRGAKVLLDRAKTPGKRGKSGAAKDLAGARKMLKAACSLKQRSACDWLSKHR